jgi:hypothetical protein
MIQRIQSVYLLLVIIAYILLFFTDIATYTAINDEPYCFSLLKNTSGNSNSTLPLIVVVVLMSLSVFVTIFLYKKRMLQIRITSILLLVNLGFIAALFYSADSIAKKIGPQTVTQYEAAAYIALIPLVFLVLANRAIRKDEKMVRSTDRLRD